MIDFSKIEIQDKDKALVLISLAAGMIAQRLQLDTNSEHPFIKDVFQDSYELMNDCSPEVYKAIKEYAEKLNKPYHEQFIAEKYDGKGIIYTLEEIKEFVKEATKDEFPVLEAGTLVAKIDNYTTKPIMLDLEKGSIYKVFYGGYNVYFDKKNSKATFVAETEIGTRGMDFPALMYVTSDGYGVIATLSK